AALRPHGGGLACDGEPEGPLDPRRDGVDDRTRRRPRAPRGGRAGRPGARRPALARGALSGSALVLPLLGQRRVSAAGSDRHLAAPRPAASDLATVAPLQTARHV